MLNHLLKYGEQEALSPEPGFRVKYVKWAVTCDREGKYLGVVPLGDATQKNNPGLVFKKAPDLTTYEITGGPASCRHFLADTLEVVTLFGKDQPEEKDLGKHAFFKDLLRQAAGEAPDLGGLAELLDNPGNLERLNRDLKEAGAKPTETITFLRDDAFSLDGDSWHVWWRGWRERHFPAEDDAPLMLDLLTGQPCRPLSSHYKIAGLAAVGGLPTGDSLVSFDKEAFRSYGLQSSGNAACSAQSSITYAEALNHLVRNTGQTLAGVKVVHWFQERLQNPEDDLFSGLFGGGDESKKLNAQQQARKLLQAIKKGERPDLISNRYYVMTLSGASGRVMVRDWMEGSFEDFVASVDAWFDQLSIVNRGGDILAPTPKLMAVLAATVRDLDDIKPPHVAQLYRCGIDRRQPFPRWALAKTILRSRADILQGESPRHTRMGLIKACLIRNHSSQGGDQVSPFLNENHPAPAYHCGRLMAVYAALQKAALGDVGAGVVQRFYSAASVTPALTLGRLARLGQFHLGKLQSDKPGLAFWYEGLLASIAGQIADRFPAMLNLEEQGLFALGYYQQLAEMRRPKKAADQAEETSEENSADQE